MAAKTTAPIPPACLEIRESVLRRAETGDVSTAELLETFDLLKAAQPEIESYYSAFTLEQLRRMYYAHPGTKKGEIVRDIACAVRRSMILKESYTVDYFSGPDAHDRALRSAIESTTPADIAAYAARQEAARAELEARKAHRKKALSSPETLAEYRTFLKQKPRSELSLEQRMNYDELSASESKQARAVLRAKREAERATVEQVEISGDLAITVTEEMHVEKQEPRWIARCSRRVEREEFQRLHDAAKQMGGRWSRFSQGFSFFEQSKAQKFASVHQVGQSVAEERAAWKEEKRLTALERLRAVADGTIDDAEEKLSADRKVNTIRRANIASGIEAEARRMKALGQTALAMADAIETQEVFFLNGVRARTHIELLESIIQRAKYNRLSHEASLPGAQHGHYEQGRGLPPCEADLEWVKYPWPSIDHGDVLVILEVVKGARGTKQSVAMIESLTRGLSNTHEWVELTSADHRDAYELLLETAQKRDGKNHHVKSAVERYLGDGGDYRRMRSMDIHTPQELRAALREYLRIRRDREMDDPVKRAQRELIGRKFAGYFPTPRHVVARMIALSHLEPGMRVLEPQAGQGHIADAFRAAGADVYCVEMQSAMREILKLKGHRVIGQDCFEITDRFDRVSMNPPFENGLDSEMVRHAFEQNLAPGGRLVAIMGEGTFSRSDAKASAFREWLESVGGTSEKLPDGSFLDSDVSTGVHTRIVVIDADGDGGNEDAGPDEEDSSVVEVHEGEADSGQNEALAVQNIPEIIPAPAITGIPPEQPPLLEMTDRTVTAETIQISGRIAGHPFIFRAMPRYWGIEIADDYDAVLGRHGATGCTVGNGFDQVPGWKRTHARHDAQELSDDAVSALLQNVAHWYTDGCAEPGWGWERCTRRSPPSHTHDGKPWPLLADGVPWPEDSVRSRYPLDMHSTEFQTKELIRLKRAESVDPKLSPAGCLELERCTACQSSYVLLFTDESRACAKCGWAKTFDDIAKECTHTDTQGRHHILPPFHRYHGQPVVYTGEDLNLGRSLLRSWLMKRPEFSLEQIELVAVAFDAQVIRQKKLHAGDTVTIVTRWHEGHATEELGKFLCVHPTQGFIPVDNRSQELGRKHLDLAGLLEALPLERAKLVLDKSVQACDPDALGTALMTLLKRTGGQSLKELLNAVNDAWNGMPKCRCQKKGLKDRIWAGGLYHRSFEDARTEIWKIMSWPEPLRSARTWGELEHPDRKDVLLEIDRRQAALTTLWSLTAFLRDVTRYTLPVYDQSGRLTLPGTSVADEHLLRLEPQALDAIAQATHEQLRHAADVYFEYIRWDPGLRSGYPTTVREQLHLKYITAIRLRLREIEGWAATVHHPVGYIPGSNAEEVTTAPTVEEVAPAPAPPVKVAPSGQLSLF